MTEPASGAAGLSLMALLIAFLGPMAGPYFLIVAAALAGALWPLSTMPTMTRREAGLFLLRIVITAVALTSVGAYAIQSQFNIPIGHGTALVAFGIGAMGNGWQPVLAALRAGAASLLGRKNDTPPGT